ncbi:54S ribosomal protein L31, mitochondrial [Zancudomyces culisetae]|uniref:54S ribosomal protein L31, mitochondrial n=1 Tax=Zancudomyces culisetae TaxID=1213189 RepID=A0A1R1PRV8_ZANCU|nr:54S ribosomal protein L31, mitochondrial [Zancudomyces culisetae]|eukprot:OMH83715.1 54S ribosomal protein L31, mitochondrial [Zancudomyces culisetae]
MFGGFLGAFRPSFTPFGGRAWRIPWRLSSTRKANVRKRLRAADSVLDVLIDSGVSFKRLELIKTIPREDQMKSRDKYTTFSRTFKGYRKGIHKVPKFTKVPVPRTTPVGF